jgi:glycerophosphoryl diester phosphodiesterase
LREKTLAELKQLDVGYGYTADGGRTFPLRGKGVGLMPSLGEVVSTFPGRRLMLQLKHGPEDMPEKLVRYLEAHKADFRNLRFFGDDAAIAALRRARPDVNGWGQREAGKCTAAYIALGWSGYLPASCRGKTMLVPLAQSWLLPGWPNRFAARMRAGGVTMLAIGGADSIKATGFWRVDTAEDLARLPPGLPAEIWTDHVEVTGPLLRQRADASR